MPSISTISKVRSASFGDRNEGVAISKDGRFAYSPSENDNTVKEYSMSTAYNVNTLTKGVKEVNQMKRVRMLN